MGIFLITGFLYLYYFNLGLYLFSEKNIIKMIISISIFIIINIFLIINFNRISKLVNIYDTPDQKLKIHKKKTSLAGGTIIIFNIFLLIFLDFIF